MNGLQYIRLKRQAYRTFGTLLILILAFGLRAARDHGRRVGYTVDLSMSIRGCIMDVQRNPLVINVGPQGIEVCPLPLLWSLGIRKNLREATVADLRWIEGVGPRNAARIHRWRTLQTWADLARESGISKAAMAKLRRLFYIKP